MSAIDTTFHWVRNPTAINGLATTYVSKRGSDTTGDGTAQNPYASLAKATSVATTNTNIMIDDGEWSEERTRNGRRLRFYGNGVTILHKMSMYGDDYYNFIKYVGNPANLLSGTSPTIPVYIFNCYFVNCVLSENGQINNPNFYIRESVFIECILRGDYSNASNMEHCVFIHSYLKQFNIRNCILYNCNLQNYSSVSFGYLPNDFNNFCSSKIQTIDNEHSINDAITGQTIADYFNKYDANDWLKCDFTAKEGSKNIGAGEKGTTIGLNQGYTMYADNSASDMFSASNGATLKNIAWDSTLNGYVLVQKERICQGATSTTITLDSSASAVDDYYNNLFVGIVGGDGYGELFLITDYDGTTKTATIDGTWTTTPTINSIYTISGTILSAVKDLGKAIKVKRNWTFADNFTALQDGQWAEFMTHVETNGKQFPVSCYSYEYSTDGVNFVQGQTADDLVSATNGENKVTDNIYGDCSPNYDEATAKNLVMRYIRVRVHIGFNI